MIGATARHRARNKKCLLPVPSAHSLCSRVPGGAETQIGWRRPVWGEADMALFRVFLIAAWVVLVGYTIDVISNHGINLIPIFFGDMAKMAWPGQFNLDFMIFLTLSALWTAWRNDFSAKGLGLAIIAFFGGAGFLLPYLLILSIQTRGNMRIILTGRG